MQLSAPIPSARFAARWLVATLLLVGVSLCVGAQDLAQTLHHADEIKYSSNAEFLRLLATLDAQAGAMSATQRDWLAYFHAWQLGYSGNYPQALSAFHALLASTKDETVRARARVSLIYDQVNAKQFEEAYRVLTDLLASLPRITDRQARMYVYDAAAYVYSRAGDYALATSYIDQALAADPSADSTCTARETQIWILSESGTLRNNDPRIQQGLAICRQVGDQASVNTMLLEWAKAYIIEGQYAAAIKLLNANQTSVLSTQSSALTANFRALLAQAYLRLGDLEPARAAAQGAIAAANEQKNSRAVATACEVLYLIAKKQGDLKSALAWHEKYTAADRGYLDDVSARALAYQKVHQRVIDDQRKLDAARQANGILTLQHQVAEQTARSRLLYVLLLISGLAIVAIWALRTKHSQLAFQKLARRDGLTGICNRQHFFDSAQDTLRYCAKSSRPASLLMIDLDNFKSVNDMHGHAAGDEALRRVVATCEGRLRSIDIFGRLGGEEFAILLPDCNENTAAMRAEEMRADIASRGQAGMQVTASIGVVGSSNCGYNLATLLAKADGALYRAKRAGRNKVVRHDSLPDAAST